MKIQLTNVVAQDFEEIKVLAETVNNEHVVPLLSLRGKL
ncbi:hypothetical protein JCM19233_1913 [Vibrio astriarenae]|nr:hypothetical protein JCM19233_1913 [Vibrio sp. C7]